MSPTEQIQQILAPFRQGALPGRAGWWAADLYAGAWQGPLARVASPRSELLLTTVRAGLHGRVDPDTLWQLGAEVDAGVWDPTGPPVTVPVPIRLALGGLPPDTTGPHVVRPDAWNILAPILERAQRMGLAALLRAAAHAPRGGELPYVRESLHWPGCTTCVRCAPWIRLPPGSWTRPPRPGWCRCRSRPCPWDSARRRWPWRPRARADSSCCVCWP